MHGCSVESSLTFSELKGKKFPMRTPMFWIIDRILRLDKFAGTERLTPRNAK